MARQSLCVRLEPMEPRMFLSAGQLDPFFGTNGVVTIPFPDGMQQFDDVEVRSDGRIVCVGVSEAPGGSRLLLARFLANGQPDTYFGGGAGDPTGIVDTGLGARTGKIELLPNGKILFVSGNQLVRFNSGGSIDTTFVQNEPSRFKFNFFTYDIDVQADGKILLSGRYRSTPAKPGHFAVARLNANGTRDRSFGLGGVADFMQLTNSAATSVQAMADGSIFVGGDLNLGYPTDMDEYKVQDAIGMKLRPDGSPDPAYGTSGVASIRDRFFAGAAMTSAVGHDGTVTVIASSENIVLHRFTPAGLPDSSFGGDGVAVSGTIDTGELRATAADDGSLLTTFLEYTDNPVRNDVLMRFKSTGDVDTAFGNAGRSSFDFNGEDVIFHASTFANDGSILVAGQADGEMMLARFWNDEAPAAELHAPNLKKPGAAAYRFSTAIRDDVAVKKDSISAAGFRIITPGGQSLRPTLATTDGSQRPKAYLANLKLLPPGGSWGPEDDGEYQIQLLPDRLSDTAGHFSTGRIIGSFFVRIDPA